MAISKSSTKKEPQSQVLKKPKKLLEQSLDRVHYVHPYVYSEIHPLNIAVAGCGGTGSMVLRDLARMHMTLKALDLPGLNVSAYDPDTFSEFNIGRQLMDKEDIGANKAIRLIERINRTYGVQWNGFKNKFRFGTNNPTILITAVDTIKARRMIYNSSEGYRVSKTDNVGGYMYWIDSGNSSNFGQVCMGTSKKIKQPKSAYETVPYLPSPIDLYDGLVDNPQEPSCSVAEALGRQDLMVNSMMSQIVCHLIWSMIRVKRIEYRGAYVNLETLTMRPLKV